MDKCSKDWGSSTETDIEVPLEQQLIAIGEDPEQARNLTKLAGLVQHKPPETDEEWDKFMEAWAELAGDKN